MKITYKYDKYRPEDIDRVYISFRDNVLKRYEVNAKGQTILEAEDHPASYDPVHVRMAWIRRGFFFNQVRVK